MTLGLWVYRDLIAQLTLRSIQQRYRGLSLGFWWSLVTPLFMLAVYTFVFTVVLRARWGTATDQPPAPGEFALTVFAGLIPFTVFSEVLNDAPNLVLRVPNYVKKVVFPLEVLPVVSVGTSLFHSVISLGILLVATWLLQHQLGLMLVFLPLAYVPLTLLCLGLSWVLASLGVYLRDITQLVVLVTQVLLFTSPIFYPASAVPAPLQPILALNPLTSIVDGFRRAVIWQEPPAWDAWLIWTVLTGACAVLGYVWFRKIRPGFIDVL
jgi:lipopolysaccharide transport system permease protein